MCTQICKNDFSICKMFCLYTKLGTYIPICKNAATNFQNIFCFVGNEKAFLDNNFRANC